MYLIQVMVDGGRSGLTNEYGGGASVVSTANSLLSSIGANNLEKVMIVAGGEGASGDCSAGGGGFGGGSGGKVGTTGGTASIWLSYGYGGSGGLSNVGGLGGDYHVSANGYGNNTTSLTGYSGGGGGGLYRRRFRWFGICSCNQSIWYKRK